MKPITDRELERYLLDELSAGERAEVERALESDETTFARLEELRRSNREILEEYPPREMAAAIEARLEGRAGPRRPPIRILWAIPAAAAALVLVLLFPLRNTLGGSDGTRIKGLDARLEVYRLEGGVPKRMAPEETADRGDLLQISYVSGGARYGAILSIDGRGVVTWHLPERPSGPAPELESGGEVPLSSAYQLDDAPGFERFLFLTSSQPFDLGQVDREARRLAASGPASRTAPLRAGRGIDQTSFLVLKEAVR